MKLADSLKELAQRLEAAGAQFAVAVVGGLAASARGEARFTRDIDVAVAAEDDEQAVFATCGIEREVVTSAQGIELFPNIHVPTATVEALLAMKVLSALPERPRDSGDIQAMVRANPAFDDALVLALLALIESRGYSRGQVLSEKWEQLKRHLRLGS